MTEITITVGGLVVTAVVIIVTTILLVISATKVFSRSPSPDSNAGVVPIISRTSSVIATASSSSSSSFSSSKSWKYDVFLSFRGEDTRKTFVGHLYSALQQHGILTYKDDVTLDRGDTIHPSLLKAIESSQILVIIFSENYADSSWCLDELSHIMDYKKRKTGQSVFPIFYHVDPSDVRKQKRKYEEAFAKHRLSENTKNKVESWKEALVAASDIAGWEPNQVANGREAEFIQKIVGSILDKLLYSDSTVEDENLVGMGIRLEQLKSQFRIGSGGVRMVGIWGLGGGGKTTLATSLYKKFSPNFDRCCFLGDVREDAKRNGLKSLQEKILSTVFDKPMQVQSVELGKDKIKQMLCRRKVLIVLDDVDHLDQLKALAGGSKWFGDGSRIIITTRDEQVLTTVDEMEVSPISLLSREEAVQLFNKHAYNKNKPVEDYKMLSQHVVTYAAGLPLALIVLGSFLHDRNKDEWLSTLDRLRDHPDMNIVEKLKISYDGLQLVEKELFLDIACFYKGTDKDDEMEILDACGFYPAVGVKVLIQKALITVSKYGQFDMHDLVEEMAYYIVRGEHPFNPEKHSRVWRIEDIEDICFKNAIMENDKIEAIQIYPHGCSFNFIRLVSSMTKLRRLQVVTATLFDEGPSFLSNELRYIDWYMYSASPFPESFQPRKLVVLKVRVSWQKELWKGYKDLPRLTILKLSCMNALVRTPDFGGLPCLQELELRKCESLEEIHQSLGNHSSLVSVKVKDCKKLTMFPTIVKMDKLKILEIENRNALFEFPKIETNMDNLITLSLRNLGIEVLPSSVGEYCTNLTLLRLEDCYYLKSIEGNFHALKGLKNFELKGCNQFEKLSKDLFNENHGLFLDGSSVKQLIPSSVPRLLRKLDLRLCHLKDGDIPNEVGELFNLRELLLDANDFTRLDFLSRLTHLKLLNLSYCNYLVKLPELPSSLAILKAHYCKSLEVIQDDAHRRCKWLCDVSISGGRKNITGGGRLLESMLQGTAVKSGCMTLRLKGLEIPKGFEPRVVRGSICRMQLPDNWYNHFSGFLFCIVLHNDYGQWLNISMITTRMKHVKLTGDSMKMQDSQDYVVYWEETVNDKRKSTCMDKSAVDDDDNCGSTWVGYISFGSLRNTLWWKDQTSTAIQIEFDSWCLTIHGCGCKLIPKRSETTIITDSSSTFDEVSNDYTCGLKILPDSDSTLVIEDDYSWGQVPPPPL